jgi:hypothetical protein
MSENELIRLLAREKDALSRCSHMRMSFPLAPEIGEAAHNIWAEAKAELLKYQEDLEA